MGEMDDIIKEFLVESAENLDQLDRDFVELEKDSTSQELLSRIFRAIHTVKGTSGVLGFPKLESVAHVGESLLSLLREGQLKLNPGITTALLAMVDAVREMLAAIESSGGEGARDYSGVIEGLTQLQASELARQGGQSPAGRGKSAFEARPAGAATSAPPVKPSTAEKPAVTAKLSLDEDESESHVVLGDILENRGVPHSAIEAALETQGQGDPRRLGEILVAQGTATPSLVLEALKTQGVTRTETVSASTIRVDVGLLDRLKNLVGELVLTRNQILQVTTSQKDTALKDGSFLSTAQRLNLITTELQKA